MQPRVCFKLPIGALVTELTRRYGLDLGEALGGPSR